MRGLAPVSPPTQAQPMAITSPPDLETRTAEEVLAHVVGQHHPRLAMACSFQKEETVLIDMLMRIDPTARVFTIDTGALFPETYAIWRELEQRYGLRVEVHDALQPEGLPWTAERCCGEQKVVALDRALHGLDAWITGLRREQAPTRADARKLEWDPKRAVWKANPLADWTDRDVWNYIARHELPYNPLHDRGYDSIGCATCTRPGQGRDGRWAGTDRIECGLHLAPEPANLT
jgi:phosphoadenosine phosphosulfate reductase